MYMEEELRQELGLPHYAGMQTDLSLVDRDQLMQSVRNKYGVEVSYDAEMRTVGDVIEEAEREKGFAVLERVFFHGGE